MPLAPRTSRAGAALRKCRDGGCNPAQARRAGAGLKRAPGRELGPGTAGNAGKPTQTGLQRANKRWRDKHRARLVRPTNYHAGRNPRTHTGERGGRRGRGRGRGGGERRAPGSGRAQDENEEARRLRLDGPDTDDEDNVGYDGRDDGGGDVILNRDHDFQPRRGNRVRKKRDFLTY